MADQAAEAKASTIPPQASFAEPDTRADPPGEPLTPETLSAGSVTRFSAVYGRKLFAPAEWAKLGPEAQRDWFETAGEADMHRTETEAQIVLHRNRMDTAAAIEKSGEGRPVQLSVEAQEHADKGEPELGVVTSAPVKDDKSKA